MNSIVFLDSGIGGIPYFLHTLKYIPDIQGVYIADTGFFPYGTKDAGPLQDRLLAVVRAAQLICDPQVYVLACNTASVIGLQELRGTFAATFVGTVPAVKPAVSFSKNRKIGIMATEHTVQDPYFSALLANYASHCRITTLPDTKLIMDIEEHFFDLSSNTAADAAEFFLRAGTDTVVLGCTHFVHIEKFLLQIWDGAIRTVDSRAGITRQIYRRLHGTAREFEAHDLLPDISPDIPPEELRKRTSFYITSEDREEYYHAISEHFGLNFFGFLNVLDLRGAAKRNVRNFPI